MKRLNITTAKSVIPASDMNDTPLKRRCAVPAVTGDFSKNGKITMLEYFDSIVKILEELDPEAVDKIVP